MTAIVERLDRRMRAAWRCWVHRLWSTRTARWRLQVDRMPGFYVVGVVVTPDVDTITVSAHLGVVSLMVYREPRRELVGPLT